MITKFIGPNHWLSDYYPCSVYVDGTEFKSVRHALEASKFPVVNRHGFTYGSATRARRLSQHLTGVHQVPILSGWDERKVLKNLLEQKFSTKTLQDALILTTGQHLHDANCHLNGVLLMEIRQERHWVL